MLDITALLQMVPSSQKRATRRPCWALLDITAFLPMVAKQILFERGVHSNGCQATFVSVVKLGKNQMPVSTDYKPVHCASSSSPTRPSQLSETYTWHQCQCGSPSCSSNQTAHRPCTIVELSLSCLPWTISFIIPHLNQISQQPRNQLTNPWCHRWNHAYA